MDPTRVKSIKLFQDVPDEAVREVATFAKEISVEEGKTLVEEGDYSYEFIAIEEGTAKVMREGEEVAKLEQGDFFGEAGLIERHRRNATVVAETPMRLITLTGWDLRRLEKSSPEAFDKIRETMEARRPA